ncbi:hypothetical protein TNCV_1614051 [Trichonephila clavipes]|nr:hypothetical protein TNCV_1614051 [Trichonephila clavipes]
MKTEMGTLGLGPLWAVAPLSLVNKKRRSLQNFLVEYLGNRPTTKGIVSDIVRRLLLVSKNNRNRLETISGRRQLADVGANSNCQEFLQITGCPRVLLSASYKTTATAGSNVVQSGRPIFDDFFQHLWPYIGNNTANVVFQMVKRLWLIRVDQ